MATSGAAILNDHAASVELHVEALLVVLVAQKVQVKVVASRLSAKSGSASSRNGVRDAVTVLRHATDEVVVGGDRAGAEAAAAGCGRLNALHVDGYVGVGPVGLESKKEAGSRKFHDADLTKGDGGGCLCEYWPTMSVH